MVSLLYWEKINFGRTLKIEKNFTQRTQRKRRTQRKGEGGLCPKAIYVVS